MAEQSFVQDGMDRLQSARERVDDEIQRVQKQLRTRRRNLERQINKGRRDFERQTRKQVKQLQSDIRKNTWVKRLDELREDASKQLESAVSSVLGVLQIASKSDVQKIDRKLTKLSKKLRDIETRRSNSRQAAA